MCALSVTSLTTYAQCGVRQRGLRPLPFHACQNSILEDFCLVSRCFGVKMSDRTMYGLDLNMELRGGRVSELEHFGHRSLAQRTGIFRCLFQNHIVIEYNERQMLLYYEAAAPCLYCHVGKNSFRGWSQSGEAGVRALHFLSRERVMCCGQPRVRG